MHIKPFLLAEKLIMLPPSTVSDLTFSTRGGESHLHLECPGDNNDQGQALCYLLRYSTQSISN